MSIDPLLAPSIKPDSSRPPDPNVLQRTASDPANNVWVSASAGTGKTKVLTDRVLRLLLPRPNGDAGTLPHKILCLTYTKAAANEMSLRIHHQLAQWAVMDENKLADKLKDLTGRPADTNMLHAARRLFAQVSDAPGGLKIMTIHAFCQSVLGRFPLEAGLSPHFELIDDRDNQTILNHALEKIAKAAREENEDPYTRLLTDLSEQGVLSLLKSVLDRREEFKTFLDRYPDTAQQKTALQEAYQAPDTTPEELMRDFCQSIDEIAHRNYAEALTKGGKTDNSNSASVFEWLSYDLDERIRHFDLYRSAIRYGNGNPQKIGKKVIESRPDTQTMLNDFYARLVRMEDQYKAAAQVHKTLDLLILGQEMLRLYEYEKNRRNVLDYTDLILYTLRLLQQSKKSVQWVLYKLDSGIDHLLVDEAQDTSLAQWEIVKLLTEEFFYGLSAEEPNRTLFVVGDEKQSIYRFQGAALEEFQNMREYLYLAAKAADLPWEDIGLHTSFRSTRSVLGFVDACFADDDMKADIGVALDQTLTHHAHRDRQAGQVELWPLVTPPEKTERAPWQPPTGIREVQSAQAKLATQITAQIKYWIDSGEKLASKNRPIHAGDIMVLVRSRNAFVNQLIRNLKQNNIPVSGADRLVLSDHIAVQDLLSLAKFALHAEDDLSLAEILKSPFIGLDEDALFDLAYGRQGSLWKVVQQKAPDAIREWLYDILNHKNAPPYEFFTRILQHSCPADPVSGLRAMQTRLGQDFLDPVSEFLNAVLQYERDEIAHLQPFLVWQDQSRIEVKREMEESGDTVRIMTVHGAKGLQAPIVFLPDTLQTPTNVSRNVPRLIWPTRSDADVPLWGLRKDDDCAAYTAIWENVKAQETAEYKRLFYVAATRAEDRLIICGASPRKPAHEESWYYYAQAGLDHLKDSDYFSGERPAAFDPDIKICIFEHPQITGKAEKDKHAKDSGYEGDLPPLPAWALSDIKAEESPRPLRPSRPSGDDVAMLSPRQVDDPYRFRRGNLTHTLLQYLPDIPVSQRRERGAAFLAMQGQDLPEAIRNNILEETLNIMNHPEFAPIFGAGSRAEVPITGALPTGEIISGQIDRLLIGERDILIIDYKSNRPAATKLEDIPAQYIRQMQTYRSAIQAAYPGHTVRCALLWTESCDLMEIPA